MRSARRLVAISLAGIAVGVVTGLAYAALAEAMRIARDIHSLAYSLAPWLTVPLAVLGGVVTGFILKYVSPDVAGPGIDAAINAIVRRWGLMKLRTTVAKFVATVATVGLGASGGLVGPMAQIGTGIGSRISTLLKMDRLSRKRVALVGLGAGIASVLQAPVSGALACMEILYRGPGLEAGVLVPSLFATFASALTTYLLLGGWYSHLEIHVPRALLLNPRFLACSLIVGVAGGLLSMAFSRTYFSLENLFQRMRIPIVVKPAIGCCIAATIALAFPSVYGTGWDLVWISISSASASLLATLLVAKMFATIFTLSSGGSGGIFAPTIAIGALLGSIVDNVFGLHRPDLMALIGIASMLSGLCRVPLAAVVLVAEVAGGVYTLPPAIIASLVSYLVAGPKATIYKSQLEASP
ncbi:MAG: chloride channel protein [Crenarchaeota archaeon]|nr:chloride channel protein [Thermoproteota archaeon]